MKHRGAMVVVLLLLLAAMPSCRRFAEDSFAPKKHVYKTQFSYSEKRNQIVRKGSGISGRKGGFRDSFRSVRSSHGQAGMYGRDSFGAKQKSRTTGFKFSSKQNRVVGKSGFSKAPGGHDSFSSRTKKKKVNYGKDSFAGKHRSTSGMFRFSTRKNMVVSKKGFRIASVRQKRESGSFSAGRKQTRGQFHYNARTGMMKKRHLIGGARKQFRAGGSFDRKMKHYATSYAFSKKKKMVVKRFSIVKQREISSGSFGGKKHYSYGKQHKFNKRKRSVRSQKNFWDNFRIFKTDNTKREKLELDLFDKKMKKRYRFEK